MLNMKSRRSFAGHGVVLGEVVLRVLLLLAALALSTPTSLVLAADTTSNLDTSSNTSNATADAIIDISDIPIHGLFLHMGKAGGGTVSERLYQLNLAHSSFHRCHPRPCLDLLPLANVILINIRDPIDRYRSNFYWKAREICRPDIGDTRKQRFDAWKDINKYCIEGKKKAKVIFGWYRGDASALAEALCDEDESVRLNAAENMHTLGHSGRLISDWLGEQDQFSSDGTAPKTIAVVLENGYDLVKQVDEATRWAVTFVSGDKGRAKSVLKSSKHKHLQDGRRDRTHSSLVTADNTNSSEKSAPLGQWAAAVQPKPLTDLATCCAARHYYEEDYRLFSGDFADLVCKGKMANVCRDAIRSIVARREWSFADMGRSCRELVAAKSAGEESLDLLSSNREGYSSITPAESIADKMYHDEEHEEEPQ